jgi:hypothetical protein
VAEARSVRENGGINLFHTLMVLASWLSMQPYHGSFVVILLFLLNAHFCATIVSILCSLPFFTFRSASLGDEERREQAAKVK